ncbi:hypothetical protein BDW22DRAFT_928458 [Trametopsis cervina]|nr:hypothetical protein BDW22DRAFT_928458 [Trametopsis cervina]
MSLHADISLLQDIGKDILRSFIAVVVETWFVGEFGILSYYSNESELIKGRLAVYTILVVKATQILLAKERRRRKFAQATLMIVLVMYIMDVALWIMDVRSVMVEVDLALIRTSDGRTLEERYDAANEAILRIHLIEDVLYAYMTILGDAIVLSRVFAFWSQGTERLVLLIPCALYLGSIVLSGLVTYCAAQSDAQINLGAFTHPSFCSHIQTSSYWAQLATPAVATILIGVKTWKYRRMVQSYLGSQIHRSPVNRAMIILVDTGLLYVLYFLAEVILGFGALNQKVSGHPNLAFVMEVYAFTTSSIVGIYPTVVVILVHTHCSILDPYGQSSISTIHVNHSSNASAGNARSRRPGIVSTLVFEHSNLNQSTQQSMPGTADIDVRALPMRSVTTMGSSAVDLKPEAMTGA